MYWKDRLGSVPQPSVAPNPANYIEMVSDNENDYVDLVGPGEPSSITSHLVSTGPLDTLVTPLATDNPVFVTGPMSNSTSISQVTSTSLPAISNFTSAT